jgi:hypothetical protein
MRGDRVKRDIRLDAKTCGSGTPPDVTSPLIALCSTRRRRVEPARSAGNPGRPSSRRLQKATARRASQKRRLLAAGAEPRAACPSQASMASTHLLTRPSTVARAFMADASQKLGFLRRCAQRNCSAIARRHNEGGGRSDRIATALTSAAIPEEFGDHCRKPAQGFGAALAQGLGKHARLARRLEAEVRFVELCFVGEGAIQQLVDAAALWAVPFVVV